MMGMAKVKFLSEAEVQQIADKILSNAFKPFGFAGSQIEEVEDFDGAFIFRLVADVTDQVPARDIIEANHDIHVALRKMGEDRYVILATKRPGSDDETEDEDIG